MTPPRRRWWFAAERGSFVDYCLIAWPLALIPSILLAALAYAAFAGAGADVEAIRKPMRDVAQRQLWIALLAAPIIETLVLALVIQLIGRLTKHREAIAIASALLWGALHASFYPLWFFGTVWSFYVFSRGYLAWRPVSVKHALGAAAVPHALVNSSALLLQFIATH
ncbi:MAG TPA: hypothetical protein VMF52_01245 [Steroidobacteraceae bacterium]|nr:hypothetical protein [Steroidobacteraceae bacterium]